MFSPSKQVVQTTCTWVVTGGTNTGVMKHVGEALQGATKSNVYCIGIATWGIVNNRKKLTERQDGGPISYPVRSCYDTVGASLDNNHSHFLLVDDGRINQYGSEIEFRGKLERSICKMSIEKSKIVFSFSFLRPPNYHGWKDWISYDSVL